MATPEGIADPNGPTRRRLLRFGTRFDTEQELLRAFAPLVDGDQIFIATSNSFAVGLLREFSVELRDGRAVLRGEGEIVASPTRLAGADSPLGLRLRILTLTEESLRFHAGLLIAKEANDEGWDPITEVADQATILSIVGDAAGIAEPFELSASPAPYPADAAVLGDLIECVVREEVVPASAPVHAQHRPWRIAASAPPDGAVQAVDAANPRPDRFVVPAPPPVAAVGAQPTPPPRMVKEVMTRPFTAPPHIEGEPFALEGGWGQPRDSGPFRLLESGSFRVHETGSFRPYESGSFRPHESGSFRYQESARIPLQEASTPPPAAATPQARVFLSIGTAAIATVLLAVTAGFFAGYLVFHDGRGGLVSSAATAPASAPVAPAVTAQPVPPPAPSPVASPSPVAVQSRAAPAPLRDAPPAPAAPLSEPAAAAPPSARGQVRTAERACALSISTRPRASRVLIDGRHVADGPVADLAVPCAEFTIAVEHPGYRRYTKRLTGSVARPLELGAELERMDLRSPSGRIVIESTPPGAVVTIDGSVVGRSPFRGTVRNGSVRVTATLHGYKVWSEQVRVAARRETTVKASLEQIAGDQAPPTSPGSR